MRIQRLRDDDKPNYEKQIDYEDYLYEIKRDDEDMKKWEEENGTISNDK